MKVFSYIMRYICLRRNGQIGKLIREISINQFLACEKIVNEQVFIYFVSVIMSYTYCKIEIWKK